MNLQTLNKAVVMLERRKDIPVIVNDCNYLGVLADVAAFAKDEFFMNGSYKPLKFWQIKRVVECAFFLVIVVKKIVACFE